MEKVSVNALEKVFKEVPNESECDFFGVKVKIKSTISWTQLSAMVQDIVMNCYSSDGSYFPEAIMFSTDSHIIEAYTNVRLPSNVNMKADWVYKSPGGVDGVCLAELAREYIDKKQLRMIDIAVRERIDYKNAMVTSEEKAELKHALDSMEEMRRHIDDIFSGVTSEDVHGVIASVANGGISESKLVDALIESKKAE